MPKIGPESKTYSTRSKAKAAQRNHSNMISQRDTSTPGLQKNSDKLINYPSSGSSKDASINSSINHLASSKSNSALPDYIKKQHFLASEDIEKICKNIPLSPLFVENLYPQVHIEPALDAPTTALRHAGLLLGNEDCTGTGEIAAWISHIAHEATKVKPLDVLTDSQFSVMKDDFKVISRVFGDFQSFRETARHVVIASRIDANIPKNQWIPGMVRCVLPVLQKLFKWGRIVIPCEIWHSKHSAQDIKSGSITPKFDSSHMTAILIERDYSHYPEIPKGKTSDTSYEGDSYKVHHFETNGINRIKVKGELIDLRRRDNYNRVVRDREFSTLGFSDSDFATEFSSSTDDEQRSPKAFIRKTYNIRLKFEGSTNVDIVKDCKKIIGMMFPNFDAPVEDFLSAFARIETSLSKNSFKLPTVETQRLYALQKNSSCELKSSTVAAGYYLKNEVEYQTLIYLLIQDALENADHIKDAAKSTSLKLSLTDSGTMVKDRLVLAQHVKASSSKNR